MAQTIEEFVSKLQADGVEAGRAAAERIRAEAEQQAEQIIAEAEQRAKKIVAAAEAEAEKIRTRTETELRLAARDTLARLREAVNRAVGAVLGGAVKKQFADGDFLAQLIREVVMEYVKADTDGKSTIVLNVSKEMQQRLAQWVIASFHSGAEAKGPAVELKGILKEAGFEYRIQDGTVQVTAESLVDVLREMVGPEIRTLIAAAAEESAA